MKIAIQGHPTRGKEIIQILESLGGINEYCHKGQENFLAYYIYESGNIGWADLERITNEYKLYTLEEFEKEFPFKVGDKVIIIGLPDFPKVITKMVWDCNAILYSFEDSNNTWFHADALKKFEMKEKRNITLTLDKAKEWYNKGGELKEIALQAFTENELAKHLPKTWMEFCKNYPIQDGECWLAICDEIYEKGPDVKRLHKNWIPSKKSAEAHLAMIQLEQLRDCWRQGWLPSKEDAGYGIRFDLYDGFKILKLYSTSTFLSFPTEEMTEEFLKCFKDLIEKARDLI